jgi:hypothetical protein
MLRDMVVAIGDADIRVTRTQVAFRRKRGFAYLWLPGLWLARPSAEVVLSIARRLRIDSPRFKQIAHPAPTVWMHHLELHSLDDLDQEVLGWLRDAYGEAG